MDLLYLTSLSWFWEQSFYLWALGSFYLTSISNGMKFDWILRLADGTRTTKLGSKGSKMAAPGLVLWCQAFKGFSVWKEMSSALIQLLSLIFMQFFSVWRKRWHLFPPEDTAKLYPTRIPYEESSIFSQVDVLQPDLRRFPAFQEARAHVVTLQPGQVRMGDTTCPFLCDADHPSVALQASWAGKGLCLLWRHLQTSVLC